MACLGEFFGDLHPGLLDGAAAAILGSNCRVCATHVLYWLSHATLSIVLIITHRKLAPLVITQQRCSACCMAVNNFRTPLDLVSFTFFIAGFFSLFLWLFVNCEHFLKTEEVAISHKFIALKKPRLFVYF